MEQSNKDIAKKGKSNEESAEKLSELHKDIEQLARNLDVWQARYVLRKGSINRHRRADPGISGLGYRIRKLVTERNSLKKTNMELRLCNQELQYQMQEVMIRNMELMERCREHNVPRVIEKHELDEEEPEEGSEEGSEEEPEEELEEEPEEESDTEYDDENDDENDEDFEG